MHDSSLVFIVSVIVLVICAILYMEKTSYNRIPRKIWTFWEESTPLLERCKESWIRSNPEYEIIILTRKNYKGYVTIPVNILMHPNFHDSAKRFADLVRLWILAEHGGIWLDKVILGAPLDEWLFSHYADCAVYRHHTMILSSLIACNKGCAFIRAWRDEFSRMATYENVGEYVKGSSVDYDPIQNAIQVAAGRALTDDRDVHRESMIIREATSEASRGPYRYLVDAKWNIEKALELALIPEYHTPCLIYL